MMLLLGLDATNHIHQLYHAAPGPNVVANAVRRAHVLADALQPAHIVACFDRRSFRHDIFPEYKAGRPEKPADLQQALRDAPEAFHEVATIAVENGFEADDGLATLARIAAERGDKCVLASPDKDLRQCLVDGQVTILRSFSTDQGRITKPDWITAKAFTEKYGIQPIQWPDYQALCGDTGDGIPGCPGWGEKTVLAALKAAGSLAGILANPLAVNASGKQRAALSGFREQVDLMLRLVTLRTDVSAVMDALR